VTTTDARPITSNAPAAGASASGRASRILPALFIAVLVVLSFAVHAHALTRDLPLQDTDEDFFVVPAVHIAATGDANPHWFGHPGSTTIYPVAALIHVWDATLHGGPIIGSDNALEHRFVETPKPFYLIARLWTILLSVGCIPLVFLTARRFFGNVVAYLATALWTVVPIAVHYGRIVRSDSAAAFFTLAALYLMARVWDDPRRRMVVFAGIAVGLAVASRYFMVALLPFTVAAAVVPFWRDRRRAVSRATLAIGTAAAAFFVSTPYFLLDFAQARRDLNTEASGTHVVASGLSPPGNFRWYVTSSIPTALTWPLYIAAIAGTALVVARVVRTRRRPERLLLPGFCLVFLVGISVSKLHWDRWEIQALPVLVIFAAVAIDALVRFVRRRAPNEAFRGAAGIALPAMLVALLAIWPLAKLRDANRYDRAPTTYKLALDWVDDHAPAHSTVLFSRSLFAGRLKDLPPIRMGLTANWSLDPSESLATYRQHGASLVAISGGETFSALAKRDRQPAQAAFYSDVACRSRLVAEFPRRNDRFGFGILVYQLDERPVRLLDVWCNQPDPGTHA
jgi:hypothetical protein